MSSKKVILGLEKRRTALMKRLLQTKAMIRGSFSSTLRRCGKPNCWCADAKGHPSYRITWTEKGKPKTKAIPSEDVTWIEPMTKNYRIYRRTRQQLRALEKKLNEYLDTFENDLVEKTKKERDYFLK